MKERGDKAVQDVWTGTDSSIKKPFSQAGKRPGQSRKRRCIPSKVVHNTTKSTLAVSTAFSRKEGSTLVILFKHS